MGLFNFRIKGRLIIICTALVIVPLLTLGGILYVTIQKGTDSENEMKLRQEAELISLNAKSIYEIALNKVKSDLRVARSELNDYGDASLSPDGQMILTNREDGSTYAVNGNYTLVDKIQDLLGGTATIFQLKNFEGEKPGDATSTGWKDRTAFYRISTNVIKDDGTRAVGTIVSKPVYDTILKGDTFYGRAWVVNAWYMTAYEPIYNQAKKIIGILYVGIRESDFQDSLLNNLAKEVVGKTGYIGILNSKGEYVLSLNRQRDGESIIDARDSDGNYFIKDIISQVGKLKSGETTMKYYPWKNTGETHARDKFAAISYFPQWDWIIMPNAYVDDFQDNLKHMRRIILLVCAIGAALGILISYVFADSIAKPLKKVASMADTIAKGNLDVERLNVKRKDEIAILADSFAGMIDSFRYKAEIIETIASGDLSSEIVKASDEDELGQSLIDMSGSLNNLLREINQTVIQVNDGADHVSSAGQTLSQGAVEQASSLEEIASTLNEINAQSRQNAENAVEASSLAETASSNAEKGNFSMNELLSAMERIDESSRDISKVVKVIDDIAFQINLLALNANVEAARAGKYGKGFAVVADEVRNLANRSADAAKETTAMVETSVNNVKEGKISAEGTAQQLAEILKGSTKVAQFLTEIAQASNEQADAVENINIGLEQIDRVTQSNSASAEESASAGEELAAQAAQLKAMLDQFNLKDEDRDEDGYYRRELLT